MLIKSQKGYCGRHPSLDLDTPCHQGMSRCRYCLLIRPSVHLSVCYAISVYPGEDADEAQPVTLPLMAPTNPP